MQDYERLHQGAMLVAVTSSVWAARKSSRALAEGVEDDNHAGRGAVRVTKHLLANADRPLKAITAQVVATRRAIEAMSLPWNDAGARICSARKVLGLVAKFEEEKAKFDRLVEKFLNDYTALRNRAMQELGALADETDYPSIASMESRFSLRLHVTQVAVADTAALRVEFSQEQAAALAQHIESGINERMRSALQAAWERLKGDLEHLYERVRAKVENPKSKLFETAVSGLRETAEVLESFDVLDDAGLRSTCAEVRAMLADITAEKITSSSDVANGIMGTVEEILAKLGG